MIKEIRSDKANWFINLLANESLLNLEPIIAGGSALSCYRALTFYDTDQRWAELQRNIESGYSNRAKIDKFNDVDLWFLETNHIHEPDSKYSTILNGSFNYNGRIIGEAMNELGLFKPSKSTSWANTYYRNTSNSSGYLAREVQFIKKKFSSVNELLNSFDFINCSVAWHNGVLYVDERLDEAFSSFELRLNSPHPFKEGSVPSRVFSALRAFKYSDRYCLDFSEELSELIFKIYLETRGIDYNAYNQRAIILEEHYGRTISSSDNFSSMVKALERRFKDFSKMKSFKKEYSLFLIDSSDQLSGLKESLGYDGESRNIVPF